MILSEKKDGFILCNKQEGITSFGAVEKIKKKLGYKKVGHAGTLDPKASGLLIILIGKYTKSFDYFGKLDKEYIARIKFGLKTDTYDREGKITYRCPHQPRIVKNKILDLLKSFEGEISQKPPAFSAIKIKGKPAYKRARDGEKLKIKPRKVFINEIKALKIAPDFIDLKIVCSSGTYIRSLANDIGEKSGFGAYLFSLERTRIGEFEVKNAKEIDTLDKKDLLTDNLNID